MISNSPRSFLPALLALLLLVDWADLPSLHADAEHAAPQPHAQSCCSIPGPDATLKGNCPCPGPCHSTEDSRPVCARCDQGRVTVSLAASGTPLRSEPNVGHLATLAESIVEVPRPESNAARAPPLSSGTATV